MRRPTQSWNTEQGAALLEYVVLLAILVVLMVPALSATSAALAGIFSETSDHLSDTGSQASDESGASTTTTPPGSGEAPSTQTNTAVLGDEISVTFEVASGDVAFGSVVAPGWTYKVTADTASRIHLKFTHEQTGEQVTVKGWLHKRDGLQTSVKEH